MKQTAVFECFANIGRKFVDLASANVGFAKRGTSIDTGVKLTSLLNMVQPIYRELLLTLRE